MSSYPPIIGDVADWLTEAMGHTDYGELIATIRLHKGRVPIVQLTETKSIKTETIHAGITGGRHADRTQ